MKTSVIVGISISAIAILLIFPCIFWFHYSPFWVIPIQIANAILVYFASTAIDIDESNS